MVLPTLPTAFPVTDWLASTFSDVSTGLCDHVGTQSDVNFTPRVKAPNDGQAIGNSSGLNGMPVSAVWEAATMGLEELSNIKDDDDKDVLAELFLATMAFVMRMPILPWVMLFKLVSVALPEVSVVVSVLVLV